MRKCIGDREDYTVCECSPEYGWMHDRIKKWIKNNSQSYLDDLKVQF